MKDDPRKHSPMKTLLIKLKLIRDDPKKDEPQKDDPTKPKELRKYPPSNLFLNHSSMLSILNSAERKKHLSDEKSKHGETFIAAFFAALGYAASHLTSDPSTPPIFDQPSSLVSELISVLFQNINIIFFVLFSIYALFHLSGWIKTKNYLKNTGNSDAGIFAQVSNQVIEKTSFTAVIVIATQKKNEPIKFLCDKSNFYLVHCRMKPNKTITDQDPFLRNYLISNFGIAESDILEIKPLDNEPFFTIKPVYNELRSNAFVLYTVKLNNTTWNNFNHSDYVWCSIEEMKKNPTAVRINYDIIEALDRKMGALHESFQIPDLHIIWNITKKCSYSCSICATRDDEREELSLANKFDVLRALSCEKQRIKSIDFAGGDPCSSKDSLYVIESTIDKFGPDVVSITTTSKGIDQLEEREKKQLLTKCEITIDASHKNLSSQANGTDRQANGYSKANSEILFHSSYGIEELTVNIPILDSDLKDDEIQTLVDMILKFKTAFPKIKIDAQLIRLMPVGNYANNFTKEDYDKYDPIATALSIHNCLTAAGISCHYHCSLRILDELNPGNCRCTMLEHKIGIDCAGNVFACAWGGYLPGFKVEDNPFYLGNLLHSSLTDILNNDTNPVHNRIICQIANNSGMDYCQVVSRFVDKDSVSNNDPLAQSNKKTAQPEADSPA